MRLLGKEVHLMREKLKKLFPLLLALTVVFGALPFSVMPVSAASNAGTEDALIKAVNKGGDIKLTKDIDLSAELNIPAGITVSLDLNGKTLNRGLTECADHGGVIRVNPGATLTVSDSTGYNSGKITGGASFDGGGICNQGTLYFDGGTIEKNKALGDTGCGGGIYNGPEAALTLHGGFISENEAVNGGGVYNADGSSLIIEKKLTVKKVGIGSVEKITNVTVSGNKAENLGNGIYNDSEMSLCDAPALGDNGSHDIYNSRGKVIRIAGELTFTKKIRIKTPGGNNIITEDYSLYNSKKPSSFFTSADSSTVIRLTAAENGEVLFAGEMENTLLEVYENKKLVKREEYENPSDAWSKALEYAGDNEYTHGISDEKSVVEITLGSDFDTSECLYTGTKKNVVVDLNGYCIKQDGKKRNDGGVFRVGELSVLEIYDSNPTSEGYSGCKGGVIADGNGKDCGGGIIIEKTGQLIMHGGTLYNCITDEHGGGIYAKGEKTYINLKNCTIDSCKTKDSKDDCHGGGIYVRNATNVILDNVTIRNCESEDKGGGLYLCKKPGYVHLKDVTFEGNSAKDGGGALFIDDLSSDKEFEFTAENCIFTKNKSDDRGGAAYINDDDESKNRNPTAFINCTFRENESKHNGSAIEVNDNGVVISGGTITNNTTKEKGAVYVEDKYDITVGGKLIIKDNKGKSNNQNLVLEKDDKKAYVYGSGLYKGSEIWISTSGSGTGFAGVKDISEYQSKYFHAEKGSLSFKKTGEKEAEMVTTASLFGGGSKTAILIMTGSAVLLAGAALIIFKKRKGAVIDNDDEE